MNVDEFEAGLSPEWRERFKDVITRARELDARLNSMQAKIKSLDEKRRALRADEQYAKLLRDTPDDVFKEC